MMRAEPAGEITSGGFDEFFSTLEHTLGLGFALNQGLEYLTGKRNRKNQLQTYVEERAWGTKGTKHVTYIAFNIQVTWLSFFGWLKLKLSETKSNPLL